MLYMYPFDLIKPWKTRQKGKMFCSWMNKRSYAPRTLPFGGAVEPFALGLANHPKRPIYK